MEYTVNKSIYDESQGSLAEPFLTKITPGNSKNSLIFHFKIGFDAHEYYTNNVCLKRASLRCQSKNVMKCMNTISVEILLKDLVCAMGLKSNKQTRYRWNHEQCKELRNIANFKVIPNLNRKPHMYKCRENKSTIKAQMQPAKRAVHALQKEMALKVGKPQIDNVAEQIGLLDQVDNDGYGRIVDPDLDGRSM